MGQRKPVIVGKKKKKRKGMPDALKAYMKARKDGTWVKKEKSEKKHAVKPSERSTSSLSSNEDGEPTDSEQNQPSSSSVATKHRNEETTAMETNSPSSEKAESDKKDKEKTSPEKERPEFQLEGRRIVDMGYFLKAIQNICGTHEPLDCGFSDMKVTGERRISGFVSVLTFECEYCDTVHKISTHDPATAEAENINVTATAGVVAVMGGNYSQMQTFMASLQVPCMGKRVWHKQIRDLWRNGYDSLMLEMLEAGREERQLAVEAGRIGMDGIAIIPVVTDVAWANRIYKAKIALHSSTSGVTAIIGYHTRKLLYVGIYHKYCTICAIHASPCVCVPQGEAPTPTHKCAKKWTNVASLLDTVSIAEGFKASVAMHQLKYGQLIGDADGSVRRMLLEVQPYGPEFLVTPVESVSDLLRGYTTTLSRLSTNKNVALKPLLTALRKNLRRLRVSIISAVKRRKSQKMPAIMNIQQLHEDIINVPSHVFGDHRHCAALLCDDKSNKQPVMEMLQSALFAEISQAARFLARQAPKLILDVDCNISEKYNCYLVESLARSRVILPGAMERGEKILDDVGADANADEPEVEAGTTSAEINEHCEIGTMNVGNANRDVATSSSGNQSRNVPSSSSTNVNPDIGTANSGASQQRDMGNSIPNLNQQRDIQAASLSQQRDIHSASSSQQRDIRNTGSSLNQHRDTSILSSGINLHRDIGSANSGVNRHRDGMPSSGINQHRDIGTSGSGMIRHQDMRSASSSMNLHRDIGTAGGMNRQNLHDSNSSSIGQHRDIAMPSSGMSRHLEIAMSNSGINLHRDIGNAGSGMSRHHDIGPSSSLINRHHDIGSLSSGMNRHHDMNTSNSGINRHHDMDTSSSGINRHHDMSTSSSGMTRHHDLGTSSSAMTRHHDLGTSSSAINRHHDLGTSSSGINQHFDAGTPSGRIESHPQLMM